MSNTLTVVQWFFVIFAVSQTLPIGTSYREIQAVTFWDWAQVLESRKTGKKTIPWGTRVIRTVFLSGAWSTFTFAMLFVGWFNFIFYQQDADFRDTTMSITLVFFGALVLIPYVFVMIDRGVITTYQYEKRSTTFSSEDAKQYDYALLLLQLYSVLIIALSITVVLFSSLTIKNTSEWESILMIVVYSVMAFFSWIPLVFVVLFPAHRDILKVNRQSRKKEKVPDGTYRDDNDDEDEDYN